MTQKVDGWGAGEREGGGREWEGRVGKDVVLCVHRDAVAIPPAGAVDRNAIRPFRNYDRL